MYIQYVGVGIASLIAALTGIGIADITTQREKNKLDAIKVNEIVIYDDGSIVYDKEIFPEVVHLVWSGQMFDLDDNLFCSGGKPHRYVREKSNKIFNKDIKWLISEDCGIPKEGYTFLFTYTSLSGKYQDVHYPPQGLGVVRKKEK